MKLCNYILYKKKTTINLNNNHVVEMRVKYKNNVCEM